MDLLFSLIADGWRLKKDYSQAGYQVTFVYFAFSINRKLLPVILAADLNTTPGSEPYNYLTGATGVDGTSGPVLESAVPLPEGVYTNMVPGFKANLDAVLYASSPQEDLLVAKAFSVPSEEAVLSESRNANPEHPPRLPEAEGGLTLPNSQFPSDHLALAVDFHLGPRTE